MPQSHVDVDDDDGNSGDGDGDDDNDDTSNGNRLTISLYALQTNECERDRYRMCHKNAKDAKIGLRFMFSTLNIHCKKMCNRSEKKEEK